MSAGALLALIGGGLSGYNKGVQDREDLALRKSADRRAQDEQDARNVQRDLEKRAREQAALLQGEAQERFGAKTTPGALQVNADVAQPVPALYNPAQDSQAANAMITGQAPAAVTPAQPFARERSAIHVLDGMAGFYLKNGDLQKYQQAYGGAAAMRTAVRNQAADQYFSAEQSGNQQGQLEAMRNWYENWNDGQSVQELKPDAAGGFVGIVRNDKDGTTAPIKVGTDQIREAMLKARNPQVWQEMEFQRMKERFEQESPKYKADVENRKADTEYKKAHAGLANAQAGLAAAKADSLGEDGAVDTKEVDRQTKHMRELATELYGADDGTGKKSPNQAVINHADNAVRLRAQYPKMTDATALKIAVEGKHGWITQRNSQTGETRRIYGFDYQGKSYLLAESPEGRVGADTPTPAEKKPTSAAKTAADGLPRKDQTPVAEKPADKKPVVVSKTGQKIGPLTPLSLVRKLAAEGDQAAIDYLASQAAKTRASYTGSEQDLGSMAQ